ncbi:MAG: hypothetical protein IK031_03775 [Bacteroidales bacterium]|nr:hypothetical protein [Bacteroidales bacterium]
MKLKTVFIAFALVLASVQLAGQAKVRDVVTSDYNRNSVSFVVIQRGDSNDSATSAAVNSFNPGEKFDINKISTRSVRINKSRDEAAGQSEVDAAVAAVPFARDILGCIFNRDSRGMMDDKTVRYRGNYDAKDQDVINARAARIGEDALGDLGYALVKGSYIVLADFYNIQRNTDKKGNVTYSTYARGYAYRIGLDDAVMNDFYEQCWIYDDDDQATRSAKINAFQNLKIDMVPVASTYTAGSGKTIQSAAESCMSGIVTGLENNIPQWEVAVAVVATKPVRAKIGTKEGLTNGARYRSYSYSEDKNGNLKSVPRGYLRATEISNNSGMSMGDTAPSEFYQISGMANIEEGWTIKQSNDIRLGVMAGPRFGAPGDVMLGIDADWLLNVNTKGSMQYVLASFALDLGHVDYVPILMELGYGYALHLTRLFEFMPYGMIGLDHIGYSFTDESDDRFLRESALVLEPGVRLAVNVAYPLQVFSKMGFDLTLPLGDLYRYYNQYVGHKTAALAVELGAKWTF